MSEKLLESFNPSNLIFLLKDSILLYIFSTYPFNPCKRLELSDTILTIPAISNEIIIPRHYY